MQWEGQAEEKVLQTSTSGQGQDLATATKLKAAERL